jgi:glutathione synthase/RimK-type ligase-like ATP-grasp enzyme
MTTITKKAKTTKPKAKKSFSNFFLRILSRHPSINPLRRTLLVPAKVVYRHGSTTFTDIGKEVNSVESVATSSNKLLMKQAFDGGRVKSAVWTAVANIDQLLTWAAPHEFKIVAKALYGSRGEGNYLLKTEAEIRTFATTHNLTRYIFEKFYNYSREYRLHVDSDGCFYTCRKMIKEETPEDKRWYRNDSNSVWIIEENPAFDKPVNWDAIVAECVKALNATGLDVGACDVKVQSATTAKGKPRAEVDFFVIEINSAPAMAERTLEEYSKRLPLIIKRKYNL